MLGGFYQSALRAGMCERFGVTFGPIVNGQAEIDGMPDVLLDVFCKRTRQVDDSLEVKLDEFRVRQGRDPTRWERAALTRQAAADTRGHKTGLGVTNLTGRWRREAGSVGWNVDRVLETIGQIDRDVERSVTVDDVVERLSMMGSTWGRADVTRTICDLQPARSMAAGRWAALLERATDQVLDSCINLDPADLIARRRDGDGRSVWIEPVTGQYTSGAIIAQEEHILTWAYDRQSADPTPSVTVQVGGLDVMQADATRAVAGSDALVLIEGPAGAGKTTMLNRAVEDMALDHRQVFGVAPTAKAARVLQTETGMRADTLAKLLFEYQRTDRAPDARFRLAPGATLICDEAGMICTPALHQLVMLADRERWRVVLVGDPYQLQAVGRGGLFNELCRTGRVHQLTTIHRFVNSWEAAASLQLRQGDSTVFDIYEEHGRITPGSLNTHLAHLAENWHQHTSDGQTVAITATTNAHVDAISQTIQQSRLDLGDLNGRHGTPIGGGEIVYPGDVVVTRRNDRDQVASNGDSVRNRELWTVNRTHRDGPITVTQQAGHGTITLPADYATEHVRLGYAATEHGNQGATVDVAYQLISDATGQRGLYVGATRGRTLNQFCVITDTTELADARYVLDRVISFDRADIPAVTQRRTLAETRQPAPPKLRPVAKVEGVGWLPEWRQQLIDRRDAMRDDLTQIVERGRLATVELDRLAPDLAAARAAYQPFQDLIHKLDRDLTNTLQPAMRQTNREARSAGFGHRKLTARTARDAERAVKDMTVQIQTVRESAATAWTDLSELTDLARRLNETATPSRYFDPNRTSRPLRAAHYRHRCVGRLECWATRPRASPRRRRHDPPRASRTPPVQPSRGRHHLGPVQPHHRTTTRLDQTTRPRQKQQSGRARHRPRHRDRSLTAPRKSRPQGLAERESTKAWADPISFLSEQIERLEEQLNLIAAEAAPALLGLSGVGPYVAAQLLAAVGDNPNRMTSEAAMAKLCGVCPIPASSGNTNRHRLNRGGDRRANNALHTIVLARLRYCPRTRAYVARRTAEGKTRREIMRCLKRFVVREVFHAITNLNRPGFCIRSTQSLRGFRDASSQGLHARVHGSGGQVRVRRDRAGRVTHARL